MSDLERELKDLIIEALELEEVRPEDIKSDEPLFGEGLGLDSIDALELGVAVRQRFKIKIEGSTEEVRAHFANIRSLARFIAIQRGS